MSTKINITVDSGGLSARAKQQQEAARLAQLERERTRRTEAEAKAQRDAKQTAEGRRPDGQPQFGAPPPKPRPQDEPAAFRGGQGLNLGHLWFFRDTFNILRPAGIIEVAGAFGRSRTSTRAINQRQNILLGCGNGSTWMTFENLGWGDAPSLPSDIFSVSGQTLPPLNPTSPYEISFYGLRLSGRNVTAGYRDDYLALPVGRGNFIFIYGYSGAWDTFESLAYYRARALYNADGTFVGYFDFATANYTSSSIPDDLEGYTAGGALGLGVESFEGYTNKERRFAAYICNNNTLREISIPQKMQTILDLAYPEPVLTPVTITYRQAINFTYNAYRLSSASNFLGGETGYSNNFYGSVFTPEVFATINTFYEFISPSTIKTFPNKLKWGLSDNSEGSYTVFQNVDTSPTFPWWSNLYRAGQPFYHALWPNKNETPDLSIWDPDYAPVWAGTPKPKRVSKTTLNLSPTRVPRNGAADRSSLPGAYWEEDLVTVWDWDDPAYCRSMCKALGFTDADLTP